jgi:hypothetical protein
MGVTFAIHFDRRVDAERAAEALRIKGHQVDLQEQVDGSMVIAEAAARATGSDLDAAATLMKQTADDHGGDFMGHGGTFTVGLGH